MIHRPLNIVILGLSLSSSWGNGHATTYRALLRGLHSLGHRITFLERNVPWYAEHRDLHEPDFCQLTYYDRVEDLSAVHGDRIRRADVVIVGSFVPEGVAVIDKAATLSTGSFCFYDIDTPVTMSRLSSGDREYLAPRQVGRFDIYFSFSGGRTLERLLTEFGARRAVPLYCSVDPDLYAPTGEPQIWDLGYMGTYSPDRQAGLERLLLEVARRMPGRHFVVAGSQFPASIDWPVNVERIEHLPPSQHASFYSRQRFTLNLTRADMVAAGWSPSVRLFEAAACGCPAISDPWRGLDEFFQPKKSIYVAESSEEVCAILKQDQKARTDVAGRARLRVLDAHTGTARAREFLRSLSKIGDVEKAGIAAA